MIEYENLRKLNAPFEAEYKRQFAKVMESGWYILGDEVKAFETEFAAYCDSPYCVGLANGLDALVIALLALQLPKGSEVLVPSNTYIATILSILQAGMVPVPIEPDIRTYNIDPAKIEARISPKTRAIMIVHLYGKMCDMDPILQICKVHDLRLVEDCAQAHGAMYKGKKAGTFGDFGAWSFYPTKNLGCLGDGGALTCNNEALADRARTIRNYGSKVKYHNEIAGMNSRLDEVQAAFLRVKLPHLDEINAHKRKLAALYRSILQDRFILPVEEEGVFDVYHIFNIRHPRRDELRAWLGDKNIKTDVHYPISPNKQRALQGIMDQPCPISEEIHATTISLPISFYHTEDDIRTVAAALNSYEGKM